MNDNELYHYGVPGMKWGVRRAQKQLAKLTGRDSSKVSEKEAESFRKDVKTFKKMNKTERTEIGNATLKNKYGKKYADAVIKQAGKEKVKSIIGKTTAIAAGTAAVGFAINKLNKKMARLNMNKGGDYASKRMLKLIDKSYADRGQVLSKGSLIKGMSYYSKFKDL